MNAIERYVFTISGCLLLVCVGLWLYEQHRQIPSFSSSTLFLLRTDIDNTGRVVAHDPERSAPFFLTPPGEVVSTYVLFQNRQDQQYIYYLATPQEHATNPQSIFAHQSLSVLELATGKRRTISIPDEAQITSLYPDVINDRLYFEGQNNVWSYSLRRKQWESFYAEQPLMDIALSQVSQLLVGANPIENFGYVLWPLQPGQSSAIGNYYENFGFSPSGTQFLLKQKPNQEVFSNESFVTVFSADGSSQNILNGFGNVVQALWKREREIIAIVRDESLVDSILLVELDNPDIITEIARGGIMQSMALHEGMLWIVIQEEVGFLDYDESAGVASLLESLAEVEKRQILWSYDFESDTLTQWPFEGISPQQF